MALPKGLMETDPTHPKWSRAYLTVQKAKAIPKEAHGSLIFALLDGTALRTLDATPMERIEEDGGEEVIFQARGFGALRA